MAAVMLVLTCALYGGAGLYRSRLTLSTLDDIPSLLGGAMVAAATLTATLGGLGYTTAAAGATRLAIGFAGGVLVTRTAAYAIVNHSRAQGWVAHPTLILGAGEVGVRIARLLEAHPEYGLRGLGFIDEMRLSREGSPLPILGGYQDLAALIQSQGIQNVVVAFGSLPDEQAVKVIRTCDMLRCEIFIVPRLYELGYVGKGFDYAWGVPLIRLNRATARSTTWRLKRIADVIIAGTALIALLPLLMACAVAVRLDGGPRVLFRQTRVGLGGRRFQILKFRSLRPADETESATKWSIADDARMSQIGRLLRKFSLDELPQLWNVLRGDMSIVGPRPERPHFAEEFAQQVPHYGARMRLPAGLTGFSQVHGLRGDTSIADRAHLDNFYIEHWSLWLDAKIMLRTLLAVVRAGGK